MGVPVRRILHIEVICWSLVWVLDTEGACAAPINKRRAGTSRCENLTILAAPARQVRSGRTLFRCESAPARGGEAASHRANSYVVFWRSVREE